MITAFLRVSALGSILLLVAGCGGSSTGGTGGGGGGGGNDSTTVTVAFTGATPTAVATKIGSGSFASAAAASSVSLSLPSGTTNFGVAYVCPAETITLSVGTEQVTGQFVAEATTADGTSFTFVCPNLSTPGQTGSLTASVDASAIPGTTSLQIDALNGSYIGTAYTQGTLYNSSFPAPAGSDRVDIFAYDQQFNGSELSQILTGAKTFSGQAVPGSLNGGNTVFLTAADASTLEPITFINIPAGFSPPSMIASFEPAGQLNGIPLAFGAFAQYPALPAGMVASGDSYLIQAQSNGTSAATSVMVLTSFSSAGPVSMTFPAPWSYAGPTPAARPTVDFVYTGFSGKTGVSQAEELSWPSGPNAQTLFELVASANYQSGATSLTFPNLSGLPGFLAAPASGIDAFWSAYIFQSSGGFNQKLPPNATVSEVYNGGHFLVP